MKAKSEAHLFFYQVSFAQVTSVLKEVLLLRFETYLQSWFLAREGCGSLLRYICLHHQCLVTSRVSRFMNSFYCILFHLKISASELELNGVR